jgi:hypothetical protein
MDLSTGGVAPAAAEGRRASRLVTLAIVATVLGFLHHLDHTVRANHIGWPVIDRVTPFTPSLLVYPVLLGGIYLTRRGRVGARYWLVSGAAMLLLVLGVHFDPAPEGESIRDIYVPYADPDAYCGPSPPVDAPQARFLCGAPPRPWLGALAVANMLALASSLAALTFVAARVWRYRSAA